jgi:hypothetical protein
MMSKNEQPKWKLKFLTKKELLKWYGKRCEEQQPGCPVCEAWTRHDLINHWKWQDANTRVGLEYDAWKEGNDAKNKK